MLVMSQNHVLRDASLDSRGVRPLKEHVAGKEREIKIGASAPSTPPPKPAVDSTTVRCEKVV
jgi:hypothetical protein